MCGMRNTTNRDLLLTVAICSVIRWLPLSFFLCIALLFVRFTSTTNVVSFILHQPNRFAWDNTLNTLKLNMLHMRIGFIQRWSPQPTGSSSNNTNTKHNNKYQRIKADCMWYTNATWIKKKTSDVLRSLFLCIFSVLMLLLLCNIAAPHRFASPCNRRCTKETHTILQQRWPLFEIQLFGESTAICEAYILEVATFLRW